MLSSAALFWNSASWSSIIFAFETPDVIITIRNFGFKPLKKGNQVFIFNFHLTIFELQTILQMPVFQLFGSYNPNFQEQISVSGI